MHMQSEEEGRWMERRWSGMILCSIDTHTHHPRIGVEEGMVDDVAGRVEGVPNHSIHARSIPG